MKNDSILACLFLSLLSCPGAGNAAGEPGQYRVVGGESEVNILVFRAGSLGRFGHNHVVTARQITGCVTVGETAADSSLELSLPVEELAVDDPESRAAAGSSFESDVSEKDRAGTRHNMLGEKLLDSEQYAQVGIRSTRITGEFSDMTVTAEIDIRGEHHEVELPVSATFYEDRLVATGRARLSHGDLGLEPFTAGFGTLRVADELVFDYRVVAARSAPGD